MDLEKMLQYKAALEKEIDAILAQTNIHRPIRCYIGKVHGGDCRKCELCPAFIPDFPYPDAPEDKRPTKAQLARGLHPCKHIPYWGEEGDEFNGKTIFEAECWLETGVIDKITFNVLIHKYMVKNLIMMRQVLLRWIEEEQKRAEGAQS